MNIYNHFTLTVTHILSLLAIMLACMNYAFADMSGKLQGPAFSDATYIEKLSREWQKKPITYEDVPADTDLVVTLDQHLYPALLPLINRFAAISNLKIEVQEGTCGISAGALLDKKVDMGGFCCPPGEADRLPGLRYHTMAIAPLALVTDPLNTVSDIGIDEARNIFRGVQGRWGGAQEKWGAPVKVVTRLHCKARPGHWRTLLDNEDLFTPVGIDVGTILDMIQTVSRTRGAIGYEMIWMTERYQEAGKVKILKIDGVSPQDMDAVVAGKYPLFRTYNITTWESTNVKKEQAGKLAGYLKQHFDEVEPKYGFIHVQRLRDAGWEFNGPELIGLPH